MIATALYENIVNLVTKLASLVLSIFPKSPFRQYIDAMPTNYIRADWLAWYFPIREALAIILMWLAAMALYNLVSIIARWVKIIH